MSVYALVIFVARTSPLHKHAPNTYKLRPTFETSLSHALSTMVQVDREPMSERWNMKGQETTGTICRVAQQRTQDDASSHGVARPQEKGCACPSREIRIGTGDRCGRQTMRQPEYRQGGGHTAIWRTMICEAGRPAAGHPSSCPRLSLLFMYLWLLGDSHSCVMAQVAFAPRDSWPCRGSRRGRPARHAGDLHRCGRTLRRSI
jgi:hypothetical protein